MELKKVEFTEKGIEHFGRQLDFYYVGEDENFKERKTHIFLYVTYGNSFKYNLNAYSEEECQEWFKPIVDYEEDFKEEPKEVVNELYFVKKENEFMKELLLNFSKK